MRNNFAIVYHCSVIVRHCYSSFLTMANKIGNDRIQRNWIRSVCFEFCQLSRDATFKRGAFGGTGVKLSARCQNRTDAASAHRS
jgi:hypothetical protein